MCTLRIMGKSNWDILGLFPNNLSLSLETGQHLGDGRGSGAWPRQDRRHGVRQTLQLAAQTSGRPRPRRGHLLVPGAWTSPRCKALYQSYWWVNPYPALNPATSLRLHPKSANPTSVEILQLSNCEFRLWQNISSGWKPTNLTSVFTLQTSVYHRLMVLRWRQYGCEIQMFADIRLVGFHSPKDFIQ